MIVQRFSENPFLYKDFEVWDVENMAAFFNGNGVIKEIFKKEYKIPASDFEKRRGEISETNLEIMNNILDLVDDKYFVIFTLHDENHLELVKMQHSKVMNFGLNIEEVLGDHVYILVMDKIKEVSVGV